MHRGSKYLAGLFLSAAMLAPVGALARAVPQDDHERHEREERERRVYDPYRKDYHNWDSRENDQYRRWLDERHHSYVDYDRLRGRQQREYWKWRHEREEHEEHERH